jgi:hypothetical protein
MTWQVEKIPDDVKALLMSTWPEREIEFMVLAMQPKEDQPTVVSYTVNEPPETENFEVDAKMFCIPKADQRCLCPVPEHEEHRVMILYESSPPVVVVCVGNQCRQVAP